MTKPEKRYYVTGLLTIAAVYFLILVGGIVRTTGSGMGCPDWPKCFGRWVPPTEASQLPADYQQRYAHRGYASMTFNVTRTWIEYINRLIGVLIGILIFVTLLASIPYLRTDSVVFYLSLLAFLLVGFQGWLGSKVVATNLLPLMISIHMIVALVIVCLLIYTVTRAFSIDHFEWPANRSIYLFASLALVGTLVQLLFGMQVREHIDVLAASMGEEQRANWVSHLGSNFLIHRSFSWVVAILNGLLVWKLIRVQETSLKRSAYGIGATVLIEILGGIGLAYAGFPAALQPVHLLLATLLIGLQFFVIVRYYYLTTAFNRSLATQTA